MTEKIPNAINRETAYRITLEVRDYECDMQGIINNAVYFNYAEHARHSYLIAKGLSFATMTARGHLFVAVRQEIDYRAPLKSGDTFEVALWTEKTSARTVTFFHEITLLNSPPKLATEISTIVTCMNTEGKPIRFDEYDHLWL